MSRRYDEAIEKLSNTLEMDPNFLFANIWLGTCYTIKGLYKEAISTLEKAVVFSVDMTYLVGILGYAYGLSGQKDEALKRLKQLNELAKEKYVSSLYKAWIYQGLNKMDQALEHLEKAYLERDSNIVLAKVSPFFDHLLDDPRLKALVKKIGLDK